MKLNSINVKKLKTKKRLGRGIGSSKGKTCGRGHKGQKSRSGVAIKSFEGGQMPLYRRLPKRGFKNIRNNKIALINISKIQQIFKDKKVLPDSKLNLSILQKSKLINKKYRKLKLLGSGYIKEKFDIEVNFASNSAKDKIEKMGGKVTLIKYQVVKLRVIIKMERADSKSIFSKDNDLKNRIIFTILVLCVYRLGTYIP